MSHHTPVGELVWGLFPTQNKRCSFPNGFYISCMEIKTPLASQSRAQVQGQAEQGHPEDHQAKGGPSPEAHLNAPVQGLSGKGQGEEPALPWTQALLKQGQCHSNNKWFF